MSNRIDPTDSSRPTVVKTGQFYWRQHRLAYERYGDAGSPRYSRQYQRARMLRCEQGIPIIA